MRTSFLFKSILVISLSWALVACDDDDDEKIPVSSNNKANSESYDDDGDFGGFGTMDRSFEGSEPSSLKFKMPEKQVSEKEDSSDDKMIPVDFGQSKPLFKHKEHNIKLEDLVDFGTEYTYEQNIDYTYEQNIDETYDYEVDSVRTSISFIDENTVTVISEELKEGSPVTKVEISYKIIENKVNLDAGARWGLDMKLKLSSLKVSANEEKAMNYMNMRLGVIGSKNVESDQLQLEGLGDSKEFSADEIESFKKVALFIVPNKEESNKEESNKEEEILDKSCLKVTWYKPDYVTRNYPYIDDVTSLTRNN